MQSETVEAGTLIAGRYKIGALLGRGGMAEVYEGHDDRLQRPVAVKVLRPDMASREDVRNRFEFEARHAARLSHPNVVGVYDTGEDDGIPFLVMELLPGQTLADTIANGPVDQDWLKRIAGDVLQALGAAHAAGIVHRDIKPANIVIGVDECAKVTDFGIAKTLEVAAEDQAGHDLTSTNQLVGTPAYLAPERIDGSPATPRSDLYSLGIVLSMRDSGNDNVAAGTGGTGEQAASQNPVAAELRSVADRLSVGDGAAGVEVADGLRAVADKVDGGDDAGSDATELLRKVAEMRRDRKLGTTASGIAITALSKVPGVDTSVVEEAAAAPAESGDDDDNRKGKGKGKGDD
jgi:tRNA A-37 threonylcarbamoyl transferase component Bud32